MKTGIRDQLIAQIELISLVRNFQKSFVVQARLLNIVKQGSSQYPKKIMNQTALVRHSDLHDKRYPEELKQLLRQYCCDKKSAAKEESHNALLQEIHYKLHKFEEMNNKQDKFEEIHERLQKFEEGQKEILRFLQLSAIKS